MRKYLSRQEILGHSVKYISSSFDEEGNVVKVPYYEEYHFPCSQWFARDKGDHLIERKLPVKRKAVIFQEK